MEKVELKDKFLVPVRMFDRRVDGDGSGSAIIYETELIVDNTKNGKMLLEDLLKLKDNYTDSELADFILECCPMDEEGPFNDAEIGTLFYFDHKGTAYYVSLG